MRLALPIGAPGVPGPINRQVTANQGSYTLAGGTAQLTYTQNTGLVDPRTLNATNTGAVLGGTFTTNSSNTITTPGTYQNLIFNQKVTIQPSVANLNAQFLFRNCIFQGTNDAIYSVLIPDGGSNPAIPTNIHFEYCTFDDQQTGIVNGLAGAFKTATRCYFKGFDNCILLYDPCSIIECANDGQQRMNRAGDSHFDCIQNDGVHDVLVQSCSFINSQDQTSAIMNNNEFGDVYNITIDNCYLEGGGYPVYMDGAKSTTYRGEGVRITRSIIKKGFWGYLYDTSRVGTIYCPTTGADANTLI